MSKAIFLTFAVLSLSPALTGGSPQQVQQLRVTELPVGGKAAGMLGMGQVSPDGRYISFPDQLTAAAGGTGNLAIWEVQTGITAIVNKASNIKPWADGSAESSTWFPDGSALVYTWRVEGGERRRELRVVDLASGQHRTLFVSPEAADRVVPFAVSPDGRQILAGLASGVGDGVIGPGELALVDVADGTKRTLRAFDGSLPGAAVFSPDGRAVAFDYQGDRTSTSRDVVILTLESATDVRVDGRQSHDLLLGWLPDGRLLFTSLREGRTDALAVAVVNGRPNGPARLLTRDVGELMPQGTTRDGRVFVQRTKNVRDVYVAELDHGTGVATQAPMPLQGTRAGMYRSEPAWAPDGTRIAYVESGPGIAQEIVIHSVPSHRTRRYTVGVRNIDWPLWQPDGRAFIFDGTGADDVQRVHRLWLDSGKVEPLIDGLVFGISPDGQFFYHGGPGRDLMRSSFADRTTLVIATRKELGQVQGTTVSPDGKWFAYFSGAGRQRAIAVRPIGGGPSRVLLENIAAGYPRLAWTPDSKSIVFVKNPGGLHRISIDGGREQALNVNVEGTIREKSVAADGRRIAFGVSRTDRQLLMWDGILLKRLER